MRRLIGNDKGSVLNVALLILILLTLIVIMTSKTTTMDVQISANKKTHAVAFYNADSGVYTVPSLVIMAIGLGRTPLIPPDASPDLPAHFTTMDASLYHELFGFSTADPGVPEFIFNLGASDIGVDVWRDSQEIVAGGGAEFASGSSGVGTGSSGGVVINFGIISSGEGPRSSTSTLHAKYRYFN